MRHAALLAAVLLAACANQIAPRTSAAPAPTSAPVCRHPLPTACDALPATYVRDVLPILEKRCFGCHTGGGVAAEEHDFSRIEAIRGARTEIADEVSACAMPPRLRLDDNEATTLLRWTTCGPGTD